LCVFVVLLRIVDIPSLTQKEMKMRILRRNPKKIVLGLLLMAVVIALVLVLVPHSQKNAVPLYTAAGAPMTIKTTVVTAKQVTSYRADEVSDSVAWSPDGQYLAFAGPAHSNGQQMQYPVEAASANGTVRLFEGHSSTLGTANWIESVAWSPDGRLLAASAADDQVLIWDVTTAHLVTSFQGYSALSWSHDSSKLVTGDLDGTLRVWDVPEKHQVSENHEFTGYISQNSWSPDGRSIVSGSTTSNRALVWDAQTGEPRYALQANGDKVWAAAWSPYGKSIATGASDKRAQGVMQIWDVRQLKAIQYSGDPFSNIRTLAWSPDSRVLAGGGGTVAWVMKPGSSDLVTTYDVGSAVNAMAWSPDGGQLAVASDRGVLVYQAP
jgi:WD40 repeat protein